MGMVPTMKVVRSVGVVRTAETVSANNGLRL